ncbi:MAG: hypothetical protein LBI42_00805 [Chitinispirillales bacterium]|jgi:hypothetical protein|nr:hypothetical protein [Chitinispirillales bacterium]
MEETLTYSREKFLLSFMRRLELSGDYIPDDLQQLVFLYLYPYPYPLKNPPVPAPAHYSFMPYKSGPHSFQLVEDTEVFEKKGFITTNPFKIKKLPADLPEIENAASIEHPRGKPLVRKIYLLYPYFAVIRNLPERCYNKVHPDIYNNSTSK